MTKHAGILAIKPQSEPSLTRDTQWEGGKPLGTEYHEGKGVIEQSRFQETDFEFIDHFERRSRTGNLRLAPNRIPSHVASFGCRATPPR